MKVEPLYKLAIVALLASSLTACGSREDVQASTVENVPAPLFMLSADGVGPLNAETPFNLVRIGDAFQEFNVIQETIPGLMNGLKMIWIISKNYKNIDKMQDLIELITN